MEEHPKIVKVQIQMVQNSFFLKNNAKTTVITVFQRLQLTSMPLKPTQELLPGPGLLPQRPPPAARHAFVAAAMARAPEGWGSHLQKCWGCWYVKR